MLALNSFNDVLKMNKNVKSTLQDLTAIEYYDNVSMIHVNKHLKLDSPFDKSYPYYMLIEVGTKDEKSAQESLENIFEKWGDTIADGVISQNETQYKHMWEMRENIWTAIAKQGKTFKYDVSLPCEKFDEIVHACQDRIGTKGVSTGYGHIGDGNLHLNVILDGYDSIYSDDVQAALEPFVYEKIKEYNGSISAEHGIGS